MYLDWSLQEFFFVFSNEVVSRLIRFRNAAVENKLCLQTK